MSKRELGRVTSVSVFREDRGILTFYVQIDFGHTTQGFGGVALDEWSKERNRRRGTAAGCDLILRLLDLFEVDRLGAARGRPVFAIRNSNGWNEPIVGLETPVFDGGRRFLLDEWRAEWFPEKAGQR